MERSIADAPTNEKASRGFQKPVQRHLGSTVAKKTSGGDFHAALPLLVLLSIWTLKYMKLGFRLGIS